VVQFEGIERQDEFVYHVLGKHLKEPGIFLDVGCNLPQAGNNTYALEKYLDWDGLAFDIGDIEADHHWSDARKSTFFQVDATTEGLTEILKNNLEGKVVDYISLDVDVGGRYQDTDPFTGITRVIDGLNLSHLVLPRILEAGVSFKCMTLEHEAFKWNDTITAPTRNMLENLGYKTLFEDVSFDNGDAWEDWWIKPDLIPVDNIMSIYKKGSTFNECVNTLVEFTKNEN
jgi:hypothetical protein